MTVAVQSSTVTYLGNGSTTVWNYSFPAVSSSDIEVVYTDSTGTETLLTASQYTLTMNAVATGALWSVGGTVTYPKTGTGIATGTSLTIRRTVPYEQTVSINNQGAFYPLVIEQAMDLLAFQIQQVVNRTGLDRGTWSTGVWYNYGDIIIDGANGANTGNYYLCIQANTSGTWSTDLSNSYWALFIDIQTIAGYATAAAASASAAAASATSAANSATAASASASAASASATSAANSATSAANSATSASNDAAAAAASASAAAGNVADYTTFSNSSVLIGTGTKTFTVDAGKAFTVGQWLTATYQLGLPYYMHGMVQSYTGNTLVLTVTDIGGSGTFAAWNIGTTSIFDAQLIDAKIANYTVIATDRYVEVDSSAGAVTITVPLTFGNPTYTPEVEILKTDTSSNVVNISDGTNIIDVIVTPATANGQVNGWRTVTSNGTALRSKGVG